MSSTWVIKKSFVSEIGILQRHCKGVRKFDGYIERFDGDIRRFIRKKELCGDRKGIRLLKYKF